MVSFYMYIYNDNVVKKTKRDVNDIFICAKTLMLNLDRRAN